MSRQIVVDIIGDSTGFNKATKDAIASGGKLSASWKTMFGAGALAGAGAKIASAGLGLVTDALQGGIGYLQDSIQAGSDLNETISKLGVVFGDASGSVLAWGQNSATALGMSKNEALAAAGTYGNLFVSLGITGQKAGDMSTAMVNLAGDLASFNNASPADTLAAIQSGLVGETEPLRQFGINLNDAALRQQALDMGLVTSTKEVLPASVKAQAAYALILAQSGTAQGDFARTSSGLANQQRITDARMADLSATIGTKLQPVALAFQGFLADVLIPAFINLVSTLSDVWDALQPIVSTIVETLQPAFETLAKVIPPIWEGITGAIRTAAGIIMAVIGPIVDAMKWIIDNAGNILFTKEGAPAVGPGAVGGMNGTSAAPGSKNIYTSPLAPGGGVTINVNGTKDPAGIMQELKRELGRQGMSLQ